MHSEKARGRLFLFHESWTKFTSRNRTYQASAFYLQRIKFESDGRVEFRLGYYIIGKKPAMRGRWVWGQFATMIPVSDFLRITRMAKRKGWLQV